MKLPTDSVEAGVGGSSSWALNPVYSWFLCLAGGGEVLWRKTGRHSVLFVSFLHLMSQTLVDTFLLLYYPASVVVVLVSGCMLMMLNVSSIPDLPWVWKHAGDCVTETPLSHGYKAWMYFWGSVIVRMCAPVCLIFVLGGPLFIVRSATLCLGELRLQALFQAAEEWPPHYSGPDWLTLLLLWPLAKRLSVKIKPPWFDRAAKRQLHFPEQCHQHQICKRM